MQTKVPEKNKREGILLLAYRAKWQPTRQGISSTTCRVLTEELPCGPVLLITLAEDYNAARDRHGACARFLVGMPGCP